MTHRSLRNGHFSVYPRYTPGSPGLVDERTAAKVLIEEWEGYTWAAEGTYGEEKRATAFADNLDGIVVYRFERGRSVYTVDAITGSVLETKPRRRAEPPVQQVRTWEAQHWAEDVREILLWELRRLVDPSLVIPPCGSAAGVMTDLTAKDVSCRTLQRRATDLQLRLTFSRDDDTWTMRRRRDNVTLALGLGWQSAQAYLVGYAQGAGEEAWWR